MSRSSAKNPYRNLFRDLLFVLISLLLSFWIIHMGLLQNVSVLVNQIHLLATFIAAFFFTSAFTIAPATVVLISLAHTTTSPIWFAFYGALGALTGDLVIFYFVRDRFVDDIKEVMTIHKSKKLSKFLSKGFFRWLSPLIGAIIIAGPFPDEIGMALMGLSKTRLALIIPISFIVNFLAIFALTAFAHAI